MRSYAEEVNSKRQHLLTRCEGIKEEMKKAIDSLQERKEREEEEKKEEEDKRSSGYIVFFKEEMGFNDEDVERYIKGLVKLGLDTKEDFVNALENHELVENPSAPSNGNELLFKPFHFTKIKRAFKANSSSHNLVPSVPFPPLPSPPVPPAPIVDDDHFEYRLHRNDILFPNGLFYLDTSLFLQHQNVFPVYRNEDEQQPLILKVHENKKARDDECAIPQSLRNDKKDYIVSFLKKMDFWNQSICQSLEENKHYHGLILERGKWDLSKKMETPQWKLISLDEKIVYVKQMLQIINYVHEKGFIWRDVKPSNFVYFGDELNLNGKLKGIDFDISLPKGSLIEDRQSTSFYTPPEIAEFFRSQSMTTTPKEMYINESYDSWSIGILILEMFDNSHYINTEIIGNYPHKAKSRQDHDVLHRLTETTFLNDLQNYIESHHKNKRLSYPILTSLLCAHSKRKTIKEILSMSCLRVNATSKTAKFVTEIQKVIQEMKIAIVDEIRMENLTQYTDLKVMMNQMQSSIPKDRATLQHFISTELSRIMACIQTHSSQTEISKLRDTLLDELSSQHSSLEDIVAQLEDGFRTINESLEEVHETLDTMTQSMVDFEFSFTRQLNSLIRKEIDHDNVKEILDSLGSSQSDIEILQVKENLKNKEVMKLILNTMSSIHLDLQSLNLANQETFERIEAELKSKCEESQENQNELKATLTNLEHLVTNINQKLERFSKTV